MLIILILSCSTSLHERVIIRYLFRIVWSHYNDVIMSDMTSQNTSQPHDCLLNRLFRRRSKKTSRLRVTGLCMGIHQWPVNSPHKWPVTRKMSPSDDVIIFGEILHSICLHLAVTIYTLGIIGTNSSIVFHWIPLPLSDNNHKFCLLENVLLRNQSD